MIIVASYADAKKLDALKGTVAGVKIVPADMEGPPKVYGAETDERPFGEGYELAVTMMKYGYNRITKQCPYRHRRCIGEKCALYFVRNGTGDCVLIWQMFK